MPLHGGFLENNPRTISISLYYFQIKSFPVWINSSTNLHKQIPLQSEQCSFCENTSESFLHLFWECPKTKVFWNEVIKWLGNFSCLLTKRFSPQISLGFVDDTTALLLHHALLIARYHIFWAKSMHHLPSLELFIRNFLTCLEVERRFSLKNGFLVKFNKKWGAFLAEQEN